MKNMALVAIDNKSFSIIKTNKLTNVKADKCCEVKIYGYKGADLGGKNKGEKDIVLKVKKVKAVEVAEKVKKVKKVS